MASVLRREGLVRCKAVDGAPDRPGDHAILLAFDEGESPMTFLNGPMTSGSIVADIIRRLENAILAGELVPGERISEQGLARHLGVSRGALREALRQLEGRGLVERTANIGARIASLSDNDLVELFQAWEGLGPIAARLSTNFMSPQDLKELRDLVSAYETEGGNRQRNFDIHEKFHMKIVLMSKNARLAKMLMEVFDMLHLYRVNLMSAPKFFERSKQVVGEQLAIIDAMSKRDAAGAEQAMRQHLSSSLKYQTDIVSHGRDQK